MRGLRTATTAARTKGLRSSVDLCGLGIDFESYPIDGPFTTSKLHSIVDNARRSLVETGCASFPGFLTPEATALAASEAASKSANAFVTDSEHNVWQLPHDDPTRSAADVRNTRMRTRVASIAYDELDSESPLRRLYAYDPLVDFVAAVTSQPRLFRLADPLGACSVNIFRPGWHHAWHFDEAEFTVTLSLQQSDQGGEFEFTPPLRRHQHDLAAPAVARILNERSPYRVAADYDSGSVTPLVTAAPFVPGTLQIFAGRYSLHHVKRISQGASRERLAAVLCFATEPGVVNSPSCQRMFWGRKAVAAQCAR